MSKRALIVEDDSNIAELLRLYLSKDGFEIMISPDGGKAKSSFDLFQPDVVFAPDPCVTSECHADHLNVGECARRAAYFAPYPGIMQAYGFKKAGVKALAFYMTAKANTFVKIHAHQFEKQLKSIFDCHLSQFPKNNEAGNAIKLYLKIRSLDQGIRCFSKHGEGFRVLGPTHMHCLPEAGD